MHHGSDGPLAEGVVADPVGAPDPAAAIGELMRIDRRPAHPGGHQPRVGGHDTIGHPWNHGVGIGLVLPCSQAEIHRRWSRVGVGGGDQDAVGWQADLLPDRGFDLITDLARQHAGIHHHDRQDLGSIGDHHAASEERIVNPVGAGLDKAAISDSRQLQRRDVHSDRPRPQDLFTREKSRAKTTERSGQKKNRDKK